MAIEQASKRILHDRRVENDKKILSLYEHDTHIFIRGKSGAAVESGNGLFLAESEDGLITDWQFFQKQPPAYSSLVPESIQRLQDNYGKKAASMENGDSRVRPLSSCWKKKEFITVFVPNPYHRWKRGYATASLRGCKNVGQVPKRRSAS